MRAPENDFLFGRKYSAYKVVDKRGTVKLVTARLGQCQISLQHK